MKRKALFRAVIVACSMLAPALQLQADPIADALKLIRQSAKSSVKKQTFKKIAPTVPVEASIAAATQLQYQEAALLLYKRQFNKNGEFTKDSNNPVLHHALAMLPNEKEPFSSIQHSFDALRHWASIAKDKKATTSPQNNGPNTSRNISSPTTIPIRCCLPKPVNSITNAAIHL